jgi:hypothetical protein
MKELFILLTLDNNSQVIVGISNIATIESDTENKNLSVITLNFARSKDLWPKTITVKESIGQIKSLIGL